MLSKQLQDQIEQEGKEHESATPHKGVGPGIYSAGAHKYAELWQTALARAERAERALQQIRKWELPNTGKFWDKEMTQPMSYEACTDKLTPKTGEDDHQTIP